MVACDDRARQIRRVYLREGARKREATPIPPSRVVLRFAFSLVLGNLYWLRQRKGERRVEREGEQEAHALPNLSFAAGAPGLTDRLVSRGAVPGRAIRWLTVLTQVMVSIGDLHLERTELTLQTTHRRIYSPEPYVAGSSHRIAVALRFCHQLVRGGVHFSAFE